MHKYTKIETVFSRDMEGTKKLIPHKYRNETVEFLKDNLWQFTEKIDGTNIGIYWDGHNVNFQGRTEKAQIPKHLLSRLEEMFGGTVNEELFEEIFGENEVILFGEGYGYKIQNGGKYLPNEVSFILFDVYFPNSNIWLKRNDIEDVAKKFGIDAVPIVLEGTILDAIRFIKENPDSTIGTAKMEGVVGKPKVNLRERNGKRVICKIKYEDFKDIDI